MPHRDVAKPVLVEEPGAIPAATLDGSDLAVGIVYTRECKAVVDTLVTSCRGELLLKGVSKDRLYEQQVSVPFELPFAIKRMLQTTPLDAVVVIGCLIKQQSVSFEFVAEAVTRACMKIGMSLQTPVIYGVLTCTDEAQAMHCAGLSESSKTRTCNHGVEWAQSAIDMAQLNRHAKQQTLDKCECACHPTKQHGLRRQEGRLIQEEGLKHPERMVRQEGQGLKQQEGLLPGQEGQQAIGPYQQASSGCQCEACDHCRMRRAKEQDTGVTGRTGGTAGSSGKDTGLGAAYAGSSGYGGQGASGLHHTTPGASSATPTGSTSPLVSGSSRAEGYGGTGSGTQGHGTTSHSETSTQDYGGKMGEGGTGIGPEYYGTTDTGTQGYGGSGPEGYRTTAEGHSALGRGGAGSSTGTTSHGGTGSGTEGYGTISRSDVGGYGGSRSSGSGSVTLGTEGYGGRGMESSTAVGTMAGVLPTGAMRTSPEPQQQRHGHGHKHQEHHQHHQHDEPHHDQQQCAECGCGGPIRSPTATKTEEQPHYGAHSRTMAP